MGTMGKLLLVVVVVGLVAALEAAGFSFADISSKEGCELMIEGPEDILNYVQINNNWFYGARNALLALDIPDDEQITREVLERAFDRADEKYSVIKRNLLNLNEWEYCSFELVDSFLPVLRLKELQRFRGFFESYWWEKFQKCEKKDASLTLRDVNGIRSYKVLKDFLSAAMKLDSPAEPLSEDKYLEILRGVNLNDKKLKNAESMAVVEKHQEDWSQVDDFGHAVKVDENEKYVKFLTKKCWLTFRPLQRQFAVSNLAKRFELAKDTPMLSKGLQFNIINEWRRICLVWLNGGDKARKELMEKSIDEKSGGAERMDAYGYANYEYVPKQSY